MFLKGPKILNERLRDAQLKLNKDLDTLSNILCIVIGDSKHGHKRKGRCAKPAVLAGNARTLERV